jgi:hypothetical protein
MVSRHPFIVLFYFNLGSSFKSRRFQLNRPEPETRGPITAGVNAAPVAARFIPAEALGAVGAASRDRAASRRAQSWNVGQTGKALERQYASWWASARGAGWTSA